MSEKTQKLSIRLLRQGLLPRDALRQGVNLVNWDKLDNSLIALDSLGGNAPKWARFLELSEKDELRLINNTAYGLVFIEQAGRWFAISFGMGHVKLDPAAFEQDFGLRVVLNAVNPEQLKSADVRTPDENTLSRRCQTSRGADQTAFLIDVERDIVRGLAGVPKNTAFALRVAGADALSMDRKLVVADLPIVCTEAFDEFQKAEYRVNFGWVDQIRHVRDQGLIKILNAKLVGALDAALKNDVVDSISLAFPVIYDPEKTNLIRYKGFRSQQRYPDLDLMGYLDALRERETSEYTMDDLDTHTVHEVTEDGRDCGGSWKIRECLVFEAVNGDETYVFSGGRWYRIDQDLARDIQDFFKNIEKIELPAAEVNENEERYNSRIAKLDADMICLDRQLIKPSGSINPIEICDFLGRRRLLIHVKDKTSSSRLSHLFTQGTVSARVLAIDPQSRDKIIEKIVSVQACTRQSGYDKIMPSANDVFSRSEFTVVYAVIASGDKPQLPFFSLVSFRQAVRELRALGYKCAFAWIKKPAPKPFATTTRPDVAAGR